MCLIFVPRVCLVCQSMPYYCIFFPLADPRPVTLSPQHSHPVPTNLPFRASKMATPRDAVYNQISLNTCVLLDGLWVMTGLIPRPRPGPSATQSALRGYVNSSFRVVMLVENHPRTALESPNRTKDHSSDYPDSAWRSE